MRPAQAVFKIQPRMTKHEVRGRSESFQELTPVFTSIDVAVCAQVKEYLTKIYDLPVKRVMTANFDIKWKRHYGMSKVVPYKNKSRFKKAFVTLDTLSAATKA